MREGETVPAVPQPGDWLLEGREAIRRNIRPDTCEGDGGEKCKN